MNSFYFNDEILLCSIIATGLSYTRKQILWSHIYQIDITDYFLFAVLKISSVGSFSLETATTFGFTC